MARAGKESSRFMERAVYANLGKISDRTLVAPGKGLDNGVVSLGDGRVIILTTDPVSEIPGFGVETSAWLSVHLIASDYTTSGRDPEFAIFTYNFPETMGESERMTYVREVGVECGKLGVAIVGGHTGSYPGAGFTVIGSGTMMGLAREGGYVTPAMARVGDVITMTKHAAIEATASLALSFPAFVDAKTGKEEGRRAREMIRLCTTVEDARAARMVGLGPGGVSSMHDATEGGVLGALEEMAAASNRSFAVETSSIPVPSEVSQVCGAFGVHPLTTMGEGALLITCGPDNIGQLQREMRRKGIRLAEIGEVGKGRGLWLKEGRIKPKRFVPKRDGYWSAYERAAKGGLR